ncbi:MAG: imidazole glycerol phosphate synthase subunit HisH [Chloroherpetonaceae bacterium]|nr:imidazole glycerol phosphate synthase subunit HisH [Chloroherpetonaceae bacterium]
MIGILDYGAGNLKSVQKAFEYLKIDSKICEHPKEALIADKILIPGVGAFGKAIEALRKSSFEDTIFHAIQLQKPVLGICLGMQLLLSRSEELGNWNGLNIVEGNVVKFDRALGKVPLIGWNSLEEVASNSQLFKNIDPGTFFYFVHSYYCLPLEEKVVTAKSSFGNFFYAAALEKNGIFAVQFHPEKSGLGGLQVLKNFASL